MMFELHSGISMPLLYYYSLSSVAVLVPEANTEAVKPVIRMAQTTAAKAENAAEPERAAPAPGSILGQFWAVGIKR